MVKIIFENNTCVPMFGFVQLSTAAGAVKETIVAPGNMYKIAYDQMGTLTTSSNLLIAPKSTQTFTPTIDNGDVIVAQMYTTNNMDAASIVRSRMETAASSMSDIRLRSGGIQNWTMYVLSAILFFVFIVVIALSVYLLVKTLMELMKQNATVLDTISKTRVKSGK